MNMLSPHEEKDLVSAIEQSIKLTHGGMSPNDAITKVASERQYNAPRIHRMVEAFNKSKSAYVLKTASEGDRAKPFPLADPKTVIGNIYAPQEKEASRFELPRKGFFDGPLGIPFNAEMDKVASACAPDRSTEPLRAEEAATLDRLQKQALEEQALVRDRLEKTAHQEVQIQKLAFEEVLEDLAQQVRPLSPRWLRKVGQKIYNGYPATGATLLKLLEKKARVEFPKFEKTANAVVFPTREPYITVSKLHDAAMDLARAEVCLNMVKEGAGDSFSGNFAANALANWIAGAGADPRQLAAMMADSKKKYRRIEEDLDPESYNRLKGIDAKRNFMMLALYEPELKGYDLTELRRAYNQAVGLNPEYYDNPEALKQAMVRNLESSGVKDPFEVKQELEIGKLMRKDRTDREESLKRDKAEKAMQSRADIPAPVNINTGFKRVLDQALGVGAEALKSDSKKGRDNNKRTQAPSGGQNTNQSGSGPQGSGPSPRPRPSGGSRPSGGPSPSGGSPSPQPSGDVEDTADVDSVVGPTMPDPAESAYDDYGDSGDAGAVYSGVELSPEGTPYAEHGGYFNRDGTFTSSDGRVWPRPETPEEYAERKRREAEERNK